MMETARVVRSVDEAEAKWAELLAAKDALIGRLRITLQETLVALPYHTADCPMGPGPLRLQPSGAFCCLYTECHANASALLAEPPRVRR